MKRTSSIDAQERRARERQRARSEYLLCIDVIVRYEATKGNLAVLIGAGKMFQALAARTAIREGARLVWFRR